MALCFSPRTNKNTGRRARRAMAMIRFPTTLGTTAPTTSHVRSRAIVRAMATGRTSGDRRISMGPLLQYGSPSTETLSGSETLP
jgi:hypothetical protein